MQQQKKRDWIEEKRQKKDKNVKKGEIEWFNFITWTLKKSPKCNGDKKKGFVFQKGKIK